ncbi:hypothetical protein HDU83_009773 [Entophlyctis luteolus]|nr:hypothetical protein HDU83_009773 [Entophlyctis luteolus]
MDMLALAVSFSQLSPVPSSLPPPPLHSAHSTHSALIHSHVLKPPPAAAACKISIANLVNSCDSDAASAITSPSPEPPLFLNVHLASPATSLRSSMSLSPTALIDHNKASELYNEKGQRLRYICQECGKGFRRSNYLRSHMDSHSDEYPFACNIGSCTSKFKRIHDLRRHIKTAQKH